MRGIGKAVTAVSVSLGLALGMLGVGSTAASAEGDPAVGVPVGISPGYEIAYLSDADLARELDAYASAGAAWIRIDVDWSVIEQTQGSYSWGRTDRLVNAANAHGLKVLGILTYTPGWARGGAGSSHHPPTDPANFARFAGTAAARYANSIRVMEIWNEPNIPNFWEPATDPAAYTRLLKLSYASIKAVDPTLTVLAGAMSPATDTANSLSPVSFTNALYANNAKPYFDALSVHPYCFPALPSDASTSSWNTFYRVPLLREIMVRNGDWAKRIWLTEFGAPTGTSSQAVSETVQSDTLVDGFRLARTWTYAGPLFIYSGRDRGTNLADREDNFGFLRRDFSEKLAMSSVRAIAQGADTGVVTSTVSPSPAPTSTPQSPAGSSATAPGADTGVVTSTVSPSPTPTSTPQSPAGSSATAAPSAPTSLRASNPSSHAATISWKVPTGGGAPTDYVLEYSKKGGRWSTFPHTPSAATEVTLSGLRANTRYRVRVQLRNDSGVSAAVKTTFRTQRASRVSAMSVNAVKFTAKVPKKVHGRVVRSSTVKAMVDPRGKTKARPAGRANRTRAGKYKIVLPLEGTAKVWLTYKVAGKKKTFRTRKFTYRAGTKKTLRTRTFSVVA